LPSNIPYMSREHSEHLERIFCWLTRPFGGQTLNNISLEKYPAIVVSLQQDLVLFQAYPILYFSSILTRFLFASHPFGDCEWICLLPFIEGLGLP
jgi:hypothetical protein